MLLALPFTVLEEPLGNLNGAVQIRKTVQQAPLYVQCTPQARLTWFCRCKVQRGVQQFGTSHVMLGYGKDSGEVTAQPILCGTVGLATLYTRLGLRPRAESAMLL